MTETSGVDDGAGQRVLFRKRSRECNTAFVMAISEYLLRVYMCKTFKTAVILLLRIYLEEYSNTQGLLIDAQYWEQSKNNQLGTSH